MGIDEITKKGFFFIISGIQGDYGDISPNMVRSISLSDLLFVENIPEFKQFIRANNISFSGEIVQLSSPFNISRFKEKIAQYFAGGKNVGIFESSGTACFIDPGFEVVSYVYDLKSKMNIDIVPIPGSSALTLAISSCGFNIVSFKFLGFLSSKTQEEVMSSPLPVIYFNRIFDSSQLLDYIKFMENIEERWAFVGINLGKVGVSVRNQCIRGTYHMVYNQLLGLYGQQGDSKIEDDITFIYK